MANSKVMTKLVDDERTILAGVVDARCHDPNAAPLGECHVVSPIRVPRLELVRPIQLFYDEIAPAGAKADATSGTLLPYAHRFVDKGALVGVEARIDRVDDRALTFTCASSRIAYRGARAHSERAK